MKLIWFGLITVVFAWLHPMHLMAQQQLLVRLGVVTYEDFQDQDGELRRLLKRLSSLPRRIPRTISGCGRLLS